MFYMKKWARLFPANGQTDADTKLVTVSAVIPPAGGQLVIEDTVNKPFRIHFYEQGTVPPIKEDEDNVVVYYDTAWTNTRSLADLIAYTVNYRCNRLVKCRPTATELWFDSLWRRDSLFNVYYTGPKPVPFGFNATQRSVEETPRVVMSAPGVQIFEETDRLTFFKPSFCFPSRDERVKAPKRGGILRRIELEGTFSGTIDVNIVVYGPDEQSVDFRTLTVTDNNNKHFDNLDMYIPPLCGHIKVYSGATLFSVGSVALWIDPL